MTYYTIEQLTDSECGWVPFPVGRHGKRETLVAFRVAFILLGRNRVRVVIEGTPGKQFYDPTALAWHGPE